MFDRGPGSAGLNPQAFQALAAFLERAADDLGRRGAARAAALDGARRVHAELAGAWDSPEADVAALDLGAVRSLAGEPDVPMSGATRALDELAGEARRVAAVLDEVEHYEKSWNEQLVANWGEWQDRVTTAAAGFLGGDDERSAELTARYQEQTRRTEEASRRRAETLARWHERCGAVAGAMREATDALNRASESAPSISDRPIGPLDPATERAVRAVNAIRAQLGAPVQPDVGRIAAAVGALSPSELDVVLDKLTPAEQVRLLALLPADQRRHVATVAGRRAGDAVRQALIDAGVEPGRFSPEDLRTLDLSSDEYRRLVEQLDAAGQLLSYEDAATAYYQVLGPEGTRAVLGVIDAGLADLAGRDAPAFEREPLWDVLGMHASGFAATTGRAELDGLRADLLAVEHEWQRHQLGLLLGGNGGTYDPGFLARASEVVLDRSDLALALSSPGTAPEERLYPGVDDWHLMYRDGDLANPEVVALRALGHNPPAAFDFVTTDDGRPDRDNIEILVKPFSGTRLRELSFAHGEEYSTSSPWSADLRAQAERYGASVLSTVLTADEAELGATRDQTIGLFDEVVDQIGAGDATVDAKRAATGAFHRYLDDMTVIIAGQEQAMDDSQRGLFDRPDMVRFFKEIAGDEQSVVTMGKTLGLYTQAVTGEIMNSPPSEYEDHYTKLHNTARLMGAISDGFTMNEKEASENASLLSFGAQTAYSTGVEVGLLFLPGAVAPAGEIVKNYGNEIIGTSIDGTAPTHPIDPDQLLADITNGVEKSIYDKIEPSSTSNLAEVEQRVATYLRGDLHLPDVPTRSFQNRSMIEMMNTSRNPDRHWNSSL